MFPGVYKRLFAAKWKKMPMKWQQIVFLIISEGLMLDAI